MTATMGSAVRLILPHSLESPMHIPEHRRQYCYDVTVQCARSSLRFRDLSTFLAGLGGVLLLLVLATTLFGDAPIREGVSMGVLSGVLFVGGLIGRVRQYGIFLERCRLAEKLDPSSPNYDEAFTIQFCAPRAQASAQ